MKIFRIWLLVFLAVLLPIRGAVAAGMLCQMSPDLHPVAETGSFAHGSARHAHDSGHNGHAQALPSNDDSANGAGSYSGADSCNLCVAYCSVTAVLGSLPVVASPLAGASISYPSFPAPAPSFISGGLERPPRNI